MTSKKRYPANDPFGRHRLPPAPDADDRFGQWTKFYTENTSVMYPAETVIRIFKGEYPGLKMPKPKIGNTILDIGCGDGRHFQLFQSLGLVVAGSEITEEIVRSTAERLPSRPPLDLRVGTCGHLPWPDAAFDYTLAWNCCYYMNTGATFEDHVIEMDRVTKPGGWIICSIPKVSCFIFRDCEELPDHPGYVTILDEHFGLRNGEVMRWFADEASIEVAFASHFTNFCWASIEIDMFGLAYDWHVFTAERRT